MGHILQVYICITVSVLRDHAVLGSYSQEHSMINLEAHTDIAKSIIPQNVKS